MRLTLLVILAAFLLPACGQSEPPAKGEAGPPGPAGPPGAAGPVWSARRRRSRWSARPQRQRTGDQGHHSAMQSNGLRRELRSE